MKSTGAHRLEAEDEPKKVPADRNKRSLLQDLPRLILRLNNDIDTRTPEEYDEKTPADNTSIHDITKRIQAMRKHGYIVLRKYKGKDAQGEKVYEDVLSPEGRQILIAKPGTEPFHKYEFQIQALRYLKGMLLIAGQNSVLGLRAKTIYNTYSHRLSDEAAIEDMAEEFAQLLSEKLNINAAAARFQVTLARDMGILLEDHPDIYTVSKNAGQITIEITENEKISSEYYKNNLAPTEEVTIDGEEKTVLTPWFRSLKKQADFTNRHDTWLDSLFNDNVMMAELAARGVPAPPSARYLPLPANIQDTKIITATVSREGNISNVTVTSFVRESTVTAFDIKNVKEQEKLSAAMLEEVLTKRIERKIAEYRSKYGSLAGDKPETFFVNYQTLLSPHYFEEYFYPLHKDNNAKFVSMAKEAMKKVEAKLATNKNYDFNLVFYQTNTPINNKSGWFTIKSYDEDIETRERKLEAVAKLAKKVTSPYNATLQTADMLIRASAKEFDLTLENAILGKDAITVGAVDKWMRELGRQLDQRFNLEQAEIERKRTLAITELEEIEVQRRSLTLMQASFVGLQQRLVSMQQNFTAQSDEESVEIELQEVESLLGSRTKQLGEKRIEEDLQGLEQLLTESQVNLDLKAQRQKKLENQLTMLDQQEVQLDQQQETFPQTKNEVLLRINAAMHLRLLINKQAPYKDLPVYQRNLMRASLEFLLTGDQGVSLVGCKSARDRTAIFAAAVKTMQENPHAMDNWKTLNKGIIRSLEQGHHFRAMSYHVAMVKVSDVHRYFMDQLPKKLQAMIKQAKPLSKKLEGPGTFHQSSETKMADKGEKPSEKNKGDQKSPDQTPQQQPDNAKSSTHTAMTQFKIVENESASIEILRAIYLKIRENTKSNAWQVPKEGGHEVEFYSIAPNEAPVKGRVPTHVYAILNEIELANTRQQTFTQAHRNIAVIFSKAKNKSFTYKRSKTTRDFYDGGLKSLRINPYKTYPNMEAAYTNRPGDEKILDLIHEDGGDMLMPGNHEITETAAYNTLACTLAQADKISTRNMAKEISKYLIFDKPPVQEPRNNKRKHRKETLEQEQTLEQDKARDPGKDKDKDKGKERDKPKTPPGESPTGRKYRGHQ